MMKDKVGEGGREGKDVDRKDEVDKERFEGLEE